MSKRNDGRIGDLTPYSSDRPRSLVAVILLALALIAGAAAYFAVFGTGYPSGASFPLR